jgi:trans-aconitate 2-methyltransferase
VIRIGFEEKSWQFPAREAFTAWCRATFVEWVRFVPESERPAFLSDVVDRYHPLVADLPGDVNTFAFYQMEAVLTPTASPAR